MSSDSERRLPPDFGQFALCLTHDVDRPYKRFHQSLYYAVRRRSPSQLLDVLPGSNPYWQFESIMDLEEDLGVRSAFYFLQTPRTGNRGDHRGVLRGLSDRLGRYDVTDPDLESIIRQLDREGWEVGVHGSLRSATDPDRLRDEVESIEEILGHDILGGRQHYLRLSVPQTWRSHVAAGLTYDASYGSSDEYGFQFGERPFHPVPGGPVVFPLTAMDVALPDPGDKFPAAAAACERLLQEAVRNGAVVTVLFHQRYFSETEFPGYRRLYRWLIRRARELGAWIGPPGELCAKLGAVPPDADGSQSWS